MKAAKLAPDAILLPADFDQYRHYSRLFKVAVARVAPQIEDRGIDEVYIDLTAVAGEAAELAQRIKEAVRQATGLSCSLGIAPNKPLAKLASELDKPNGPTILTRADLPRRIWPLAVCTLNGIGPKTSATLNAMGIRSLGDLAAAVPEVLIQAFGERHGRWLCDAAQGHDTSPVVTVREPRSLSRETTFERDLHPAEDQPLLSGILLDLCERLHGDLTRKDYRGKTVGIKIRFEDFHSLTRELTLETDVAAAADIRRGGTDLPTAGRAGPENPSAGDTRRHTVARRQPPRNSRPLQHQRLHRPTQRSAAGRSLRQSTQETTRHVLDL